MLHKYFIMLFILDGKHCWIVYLCAKSDIVAGGIRVVDLPKPLMAEADLDPHLVT